MNSLRNLGIYFAVALVLMTIGWKNSINGIALIFLGLFTIKEFCSSLNKIDLSKITIFSYSLIFFGIWQMLSILWTEDFASAYRGLGQKSLFVIVPFVFSQIRNLTYREFKLLLKFIIFGALSTNLFLLIKAAEKFNIYLDPDLFYYENLTLPFGLSPIYLSLINATCLFVVVSKQIFKNNTIKFILTIGFLFMLFLLQSKMIITLIFFICLNQFLIKSYFNKAKKIKVIVLLIVSLIFTPVIIKVSNRFEDVLNSEIRAPLTDSDLSRMRVDGLSIRLFQTRVFFELISEDPKVLFLGYGLKGHQEFLDKKYAEYNLYLGDKDENGLLGLNLHNQYLYTWLTTGIVGLSLLLSILFLLVRMKQNLYYSEAFANITTLFIFEFFVEMVLERHQGAVLFIFVVLIFTKSPIKQ